MLDCSLTIVYKMFQKRCLMKNITLLSALLLTLGSVSAQAQMTVRRAPHSTSPLETLKAKVARSMGKLSFKDIKMVEDQRSAAVRLGIMARQRPLCDLCFKSICSATVDYSRKRCFVC